jgi:alkylation response protein AidB-like acyl-CoA dehydrogenase
MSTAATQPHSSSADLATVFAELNALHGADQSTDRFSPEKWEVVRRGGLTRLPFASRWGGLGEDLPGTMRVFEALGHGCRDGGLRFALCTHVVSAGVPLQRFGSPALQDRYLRSLCDGRTIGAHAISEPTGGSDALAMRTTAERHAGGYVLNGVKAFVTNGPIAGVLVVYARTSAQAGPFGITAFLVPSDIPGVHVGEPLPKMGLHGAPLSTLTLDHCEVPDTNVIGRPGSGYLVLDYVMTWEILCTFAATVGVMQHRLERCIEHARTRQQFGQPIGAFQAISNKIVDMKVAVDTARGWLYETARRVTADNDVTTHLAIAKLVASEADVASALAAVQIFGASGYIAATGLEADLRDAVAGTIYSGTSEIQRSKIARTLGLGERTRSRWSPAA